MPLDQGPQDRSALGARQGASYARQYPYALEAPRRRPWSRIANAGLSVLLAAMLGAGLAIVLVDWSAMPW